MYCIDLYWLFGKLFISENKLHYMAYFLFTCCRVLLDNNLLNLFVKEIFFMTFLYSVVCTFWYKTNIVHPICLGCVPTFSIFWKRLHWMYVSCLSAQCSLLVMLWVRRICSQFWSYELNSKNSHIILYVLTLMIYNIWWTV